MELKEIVTLDGPSGSGKGTIATLIAQSLKSHYLDSGVHYRSLAFLVLQNNIDPSDRSKITQLLADFELSFSVNNDQTITLRLNGDDITKSIRREDCGNMASKIAVCPDVREFILHLQRAYYRLPGLVTDGRDMGTVVFPDARWKIYLHASLEITSQRRYSQLKEKGLDVNLKTILKEMKQRDVRDSKRDVAPLKAAEDAYFLDTDKLTISQVVDKAILFIETGKKS